MVQREDRPLNVFGTRLPTVDSAIFSATESLTQSNAESGTRGNSTQPASAFVQKADAVLSNELIDRQELGTEARLSEFLSSSNKLKANAGAVHQEPEDLVETIIEVAKDLPEQCTEISSSSTMFEGLMNGSDDYLVPLLKFRTPIAPGQTGYIDFTLINDDPEEGIEFRLHTIQLVGMSGHSIPDSQVTMSPITGKILPGSSVDGRIKVCVPTNTPQGSYGGVLRTQEINQLQAIVQLVVSSQERSGL